MFLSWLYFALIGRKYTDMARQVVIDLHKAHSNKAVEPGVGNLLDDILVSSLVVGILRFSSNQVCQMLALVDGFAADCIRLGCSDVIKLCLSC